MAAGNTLIFEGTRWQTARAIPLGSSGLFEITATGRGRKWQTDSTLAFWRSFAELDLDDGDAVARFAQHHGDPWLNLDVGERSHTLAWKPLAVVLAEFAAAWGPAGKDGVSRVAADQHGFKRAEMALRDRAVPLTDHLEVLPDPKGGLGLVVRAKSLAAFMSASAASALHRRVPMRRCQHCGDWMEAIRRDARFCSSSCRSFYSQQRKEK